MNGFNSLLGCEDELERASCSLRALSHPIRLKILCTLANGESSVLDIVRRVGTSQSNVSQHLAILREYGLLTTRRDANRVYYRVGDTRTLSLIRLMRELVCEPG